MSKEYKKSRREFLHNIGRAAIAGLLLFGAGSLVSKKGVKNIEECTGDGICRGCIDLKGCGLPQALSLRKHTGNSG